MLTGTIHTEKDCRAILQFFRVIRKDLSGAIQFGTNPARAIVQCESEEVSIAGRLLFAARNIKAQPPKHHQAAPTTWPAGSENRTDDCDKKSLAGSFCCDTNGIVFTLL